MLVFFLLNYLLTEIIKMHVVFYWEFEENLSLTSGKVQETAETRGIVVTRTCK